MFFSTLDFSYVVKKKNPKKLPAVFKFIDIKIHDKLMSNVNFFFFLHIDMRQLLIFLG